MKIRITPLNIVTSVLLVAIGYPVVAGTNKLYLSGIVPLLLLTMLSFISDLLIRRFIPELKRIWIIEFLFLIFVAILIAVIRRFN